MNDYDESVVYLNIAADSSTTKYRTHTAEPVDLEMRKGLVGKSIINEGNKKTLSQNVAHISTFLSIVLCIM